MRIPPKMYVRPAVPAFLPVEKTLLALEALAVHALLLGGVGLVGADLHGGQSAVLLVAAMVSALLHSAVDSGVGIVVHEEVSFEKDLDRPKEFTPVGLISESSLCANK